MSESRSALVTSPTFSLPITLIPSVVQEPSLLIVNFLLAPSPLSTLPFKVIYESELFVVYSWPSPYIVIGIPNNKYVVPFASLLAETFEVESITANVIES